MKNNYKKIFIGLAVIAILLPATSVLAASFNNDPQDYQTLRVGNITDNPNSTSASWGVTVNADTGETINFAIYYHNTSNETANNVRVRLTPQITGTGTSQTFTAYLWADNASQVSGSATVNLSSSQSISYKTNGVVWRPNQNVWESQPLLNNQNGSEIFSANGLLLGNIALGWSAQGNIMVSYLVGSTLSTPSGQIPTVSTNSANNISQNSANLSGSVNPNGSITAAWFEYGVTQSLGNTVGSQSMGSGNSFVNISTYLGYLNPNTTYYYRAVAQNSFGAAFGTIMSFNTQYGGGQTGQAPIVSTNTASNISPNFATLNASVNPNNSSTNVWFEYGVTQSLGYTVGSQFAGSFNYSTNINSYLSNLSPNTIYYFRAVASNSQGTTYGSILSFTTTGDHQFIGNAPIVNTSVATFIFSNAALLNGLINPNNNLTTGWFEWGETISFGNKTTSQAMGQGNASFPIAFSLSGLKSDTVYYFRAAGQNSRGTSYGDILMFRTQKTVPVQQIIERTEPTIIYITTVANNNAVSLVKIIPTIDSPDPKSGDEIIFAVIYLNEGRGAVKNAVLKITLPEEVDYISSNNIQPFSVDGKNLKYNIGGIAGYGQGVITLKVKIKDSVKNGTALVFNATLDYSDIGNGFQSINAYLTIIIRNVVEDKGLLMASIIGLSGFLFNNLLPIILGLMLGLAIYYFFTKRKKDVNQETSLN